MLHAETCLEQVMLSSEFQIKIIHEGAPLVHLVEHMHCAQRLSPYSSSTGLKADISHR